jgi:hypothetical protein
LSVATPRLTPPITTFAIFDVPKSDWLPMEVAPASVDNTMTGSEIIVLNPE